MKWLGALIVAGSVLAASATTGVAGPDIRGAIGTPVEAIVSFEGDPVGDVARSARYRGDLGGRLSGAELERLRSGSGRAVAARRERARDSALGVARRTALRAPAADRTLQRLVHEAGAQILEVDPIANSLRVRGLPSALAGVARLRMVRSVEPAVIANPLGLGDSSAAVGAPAFWGAGFLGGLGSADVPSPDGKGSADLAILNDDPEQAHPAFNGIEFQTPLYSPGGTSTLCGQASFGCEHGTEVTSMAVSRGASGCEDCRPQDAMEKGIAPGLDTVLNASPDFSSPSAWALGFDTEEGFPGDRIQPGAQDAAEVLNNSSGSPADADDDAGLRAVDRVVSQFGVAYTQPSGNEGPSRTVNSPCIAFNTLCTGGYVMNSITTSSDDTMAPFSSRGPTPSGRKKPDLVAVADSAVANQHWLTECAPQGVQEDCLWSSNTGTSFAAPQVAGAAALLAGSGLSDPLAQKAVLLSSTRLGRATPASAMGTQTGWQPDWGWGALDLEQALQQRTHFWTGDVEGRQAQFFRSTVQNPGERATLVWNRRNIGCLGAGCGDNNSQNFVLSNLDLVERDEATGAVRSSSASAIDNVEQVTSPSAGEVVYVVRAASEVDGPDAVDAEPFAIAARGQVFPLEAPRPDISIEPAPAAIRRNVDLSLSTTIANPSGDLTAEQVTATLELPPGVELAAGSSPATVAVGTLAKDGTAGDSAAVQWVVRGATDGVKDLRFRVTAERYGETLSRVSSRSVRIDGAAPVTSISVPAGTRDDPAIPVGWSASDGDGSGIAASVVEVSTDGGPYAAWRSGEPVGSGRFVGERGRSYVFRLRVRDALDQEGSATSDVVVVAAAPVPSATASPAPTIAPPRLPSRLRIDSIELSRTRLVVGGYLRPGATGTLRATLTGTVRKRARSASKSLQVRGRFFTLRLALPRPLRGVRRGRVLLSYSGNDAYLPDRARRTVRR